MALGLQTGGSSGDIKPYIKYDSRAGRMFRIDRSQNATGQYESKEVDITKEATFIADMANIRVGWVNFTAQGPIQRMVILGKDPLPPKPTDLNAEGKPAFKQGFEIDVLLSKEAGGGPARKLGSSAGCVIEAMDALHDAYTSAPEAAAGKLPVVKLADAKAVKAGQSTNYKPIFEIVNWLERPAGLPMPTVTGSPAAQTPPSTGSTQAAPPPPKQAPQPETVDAMSFG